MANTARKSANGTEKPANGTEPEIEQVSGTETANGTGEPTTGEPTESSTSESTSGTSFEFGDTPTGEPVKRGRGRPRKTENIGATSQGKTTSKKKSKSDAKQAAKVVMDMLQGMTTVALQKDTSFNEFEKMLIEPSLSTVLEDMDDSAFERYGKILNPLVLALGFGIWGFRIMPKVEPKRKANNNANINAEVQQNPTENVSSSYHDDIVNNGYQTGANLFD